MSVEKNRWIQFGHGITVQRDHSAIDFEVFDGNEKASFALPMADAPKLIAKLQFLYDEWLAEPKPRG